jgi:hypothetical protein
MSTIQETESAVPTNSMGGSSSVSGPIQTFDPLLKTRGKRRVVTRFTEWRKKQIQKEETGG